MDIIPYEIIKSNGSIGAILIDSGRLSPEDAEAVLRLQKERGLRFGDAAIELGFVTDQDIQHALSCQYDYPYLLPGDQRISESVVAAFQPFNRMVEQLRVLRSQLMLRWYDPIAECKTLAIVSPGSKEGRSFVAANLAVVFSQLGERTLLIDADLRKPDQDELFRTPNSLGLSSILSDRCRPEQAIQRVNGLRALSLLPSGPKPPNPQELLARPAFATLLHQARGQFDVIIIDTPAASENADAQTIAARCGAALVVARKDMTSAGPASRMAAFMQQGGTHIVGAVMNNG
ncbi:MAG: chain length determinant protein tyrosine kinase EpsG [Rhodocyclaceae bacterium]|nr:chain length determinant protein tyrosine kinase EpsG [Rhodocyclaceae bacterium]